MLQMNRYTFKLEAKWVKDLEYIRGNGQHVVREKLHLPEHWNLKIRYRDLNPDTLSEEDVTIDVFARTDGDPTGKRHYCQLWVPYKLEQEATPKWRPPLNITVRDGMRGPGLGPDLSLSTHILGSASEMYGKRISPSHLVWDGTKWLHLAPMVGVSTDPVLMTVEGAMMSLYDLYKDKLTDKGTPSFIKVDAGYQMTGNDDEWVLAKEPRLDV